MSKSIFLVCLHDRHTDDHYVAFEDEQKAKDECLNLMNRNFRNSTWEQNNQYGDWCLYISDDYYAFVQKVEVKK